MSNRHGGGPLRTILLLTTSTGTPERQAGLARLFASLERNLALLPERTTLRHLVLLQNGTRLAEPAPWFTTVLHETGSLSLSAARNKLLFAVEDELGAATMVGFPDDDAWYPDSLLSGLLSRLDDPLRPHVLLTRYGSDPSGNARFCTGRALTPPLVQRMAASPSMFFTGAVVRAAGRFDPGLGVGPGVRFVGGEDTDFAFRAWRLGGRRGLLLDAPLIGHRDKQRNLSARYLAGNSFVLVRQLRHHPALVAELLRKWAAFAWFAGCGLVPISRAQSFFAAQIAGLGTAPAG